MFGGSLQILSNVIFDVLVSKMLEAGFSFAKIKGVNEMVGYIK